jgi:hypothetical protein
MKCRCEDCEYQNLKDNQDVKVVMASAIPGDILNSERGKITYTWHNGKFCPYIDNEKRYEPVCRMPCITKIM